MAFQKNSSISLPRCNSCAWSRDRRRLPTEVRDINIPEVGQLALNVAYVLEGSVRKAGNSIRITAQLIEAATDKHLWSETL